MFENLSSNNPKSAYFGANRRSEQRYPAQFTALISHSSEDKYLNCCFKNISQHGFQIECAHPLPEHCTVHILLPFDYSSTSIQDLTLSGTVVWYTSSPANKMIQYGGKFLFDHIQPHGALQKILSAHH